MASSYASMRMMELTRIKSHHRKSTRKDVSMDSVERAQQALQDLRQQRLSKLEKRVIERQEAIDLMENLRMKTIEQVRKQESMQITMQYLQKKFSQQFLYRLHCLRIHHRHQQLAAIKGDILLQKRALTKMFWSLIVTSQHRLLGEIKGKQALLIRSLSILRKYIKWRRKELENRIKAIDHFKILTYKRLMDRLKWTGARQYRDQYQAHYTNIYRSLGQAWKTWRYVYHQIARYNHKTDAAGEICIIRKNRRKLRQALIQWRTCTTISSINRRVLRHFCKQALQRFLLALRLEVYRSERKRSGFRKSCRFRERKDIQRYLTTWICRSQLKRTIAEAVYHHCHFGRGARLRKRKWFSVWKAYHNSRIIRKTREFSIVQNRKMVKGTTYRNKKTAYSFPSNKSNRQLKLIDGKASKKRCSLIIVLSALFQRFVRAIQKSRSRRIRLSTKLSPQQLSIVRKRKLFRIFIQRLGKVARRFRHHKKQLSARSRNLLIQALTRWIFRIQQIRALSKNLQLIKKYYIRQKCLQRTWPRWLAYRSYLRVQNDKYEIGRQTFKRNMCKRALGSWVNFVVKAKAEVSPVRIRKTSSRSLSELGIKRNSHAMIRAPSKSLVPIQGSLHSIPTFSDDGEDEEVHSVHSSDSLQLADLNPPRRINERPPVLSSRLSRQNVVAAQQSVFLLPKAQSKDNAQILSNPNKLRSRFARRTVPRALMQWREHVAFKKNLYDELYKPAERYYRSVLISRYWKRLLRARYSKREEDSFIRNYRTEKQIPLLLHLYLRRLKHCVEERYNIKADFERAEWFATKQYGKELMRIWHNVADRSATINRGYAMARSYHSTKIKRSRFSLLKCYLHNSKEAAEKSSIAKQYFRLEMKRKALQQWHRFNQGRKIMDKSRKTAKNYLQCRLLVALRKFASLHLIKKKEIIQKCKTLHSVKSRRKLSRAFSFLHYFAQRRSSRAKMSAKARLLRNSHLLRKCFVSGLKVFIQEAIGATMALFAKSRSHMVRRSLRLAFRCLKDRSRDRKNEKAKVRSVALTCRGKKMLRIRWLQYFVQNLRKKRKESKARADHYWSRKRCQLLFRRWLYFVLLSRKKIYRLLSSLQLFAKDFTRNLTSDLSLKSASKISAVNSFKKSVVAPKQAKDNRDNTLTLRNEMTPVSQWMRKQRLKNIVAVNKWITQRNKQRRGIRGLKTLFRSLEMKKKEMTLADRTYYLTHTRHFLLQALPSYIQEQRSIRDRYRSCDRHYIYRLANQSVATLSDYVRRCRFEKVAERTYQTNCLSFYYLWWRQLVLTPAAFSRLYSITAERTDTSQNDNASKKKVKVMGNRPGTIQALIYDSCAEREKIVRDGRDDTNKDEYLPIDEMGQLSFHSALRSLMKKAKISMMSSGRLSQSLKIAQAATHHFRRNVSSFFNRLQELRLQSRRRTTILSSSILPMGFAAQRNERSVKIGTKSGEKKRKRVLDSEVMRLTLVKNAYQQMKNNVIERHRSSGQMQQANQSHNLRLLRDAFYFYLTYHRDHKHSTQVHLLLLRRHFARMRSIASGRRKTRNVLRLMMHSISHSSLFHSFREWKIDTLIERKCEKALEQHKRSDLEQAFETFFQGLRLHKKRRIFLQKSREHLLQARQKRFFDNCFASLDLRYKQRDQILQAQRYYLDTARRTVLSNLLFFRRNRIAMQCFSRRAFKAFRSAMQIQIACNHFHKTLESRSIHSLLRNQFDLFGIQLRKLVALRQIYQITPADKLRYDAYHRAATLGRVLGRLKKGVEARRTAQLVGNYYENYSWYYLLRTHFLKLQRQYFRRLRLRKNKSLLVELERLQKQRRVMRIWDALLSHRIFLNYQKQKLSVHAQSHRLRAALKWLHKFSERRQAKRRSSFRKSLVHTLPNEESLVPQ